MEVVPTDHIVWLEMNRGIIEFTHGTRSFAASYVTYDNATDYHYKLVAALQLGHQNLIVQHVYKHDIDTSNDGHEQAVVKLLSLFRLEILRRGE